MFSIWFLFTVHFVMKCDDDSFVNVPNLIHFLLGGTIPVYLATLHHYNDRTVRTRSSINRLKYQKNLLVGSLFCHVKPISNYRSKWWVCSWNHTDFSESACARDEIIDNFYYLLWNGIFLGLHQDTCIQTPCIRTIYLAQAMYLRWMQLKNCTMHQWMLNCCIWKMFIQLVM